ncbi:hypothetical protein Tco_1335404 [Tanacetum coccineum]
MSTKVPTADMIELESIFGPLFDEYFNGVNQVVSKSSAVTAADAPDKRQQQQDSTSSTSTIATTITADGNFNFKAKTQYCPKAKQSTEGTSNSLKKTPFVGTNKGSTSCYNKESPSNKCSVFSLSNSFKALNIDNLFNEKVAPGSKATTSGMQEEGQISTPIVEKNNVLEKQIMKCKLVLVDDDEKPLEKVDYPVNSNSDDEVEPIENETVNFLASKGIDNSCSPIWKALLGMRNKATEHMKLPDGCSVDEAIERGVWKWPTEWFSKYPILKNYLVPILKDSEKDVAKWMDNNRQLVDFSVKNVWKDRDRGGEKVNRKPMYVKPSSVELHCLLLWNERNARYFGNIKRNEDVLCQEIEDTFRMRLMSLKVKESRAVKNAEIKGKLKLQRTSMNTKYS